MATARLKHAFVLLAGALVLPGLALALDARPPVPATTGAGSLSDDGGEWIVAPGESPLSLARLLYPGEPAVQRRFIRRLAERNPQLAIDADGRNPLPVGAPLRTPDWRTLGIAESAARPSTRSRTAFPQEAAPQEAVPQEAAREAKLPAAPPVPTMAVALPETAPRPRPVAGAAPPERTAELALRLAVELKPGGEVSASRRDMLRLEYRLLRSVDDLAGQLPAGESDLPSAAHADSVPAETVPPTPAPAPAVVPAPAVSPVADAAPAAAPVKIRQLAPEPASPTSAPGLFANTRDMLYFAGAAVALLLALLLVSSLRRRRAAAPPATFDLAQTVMLAHPPGRPAAAAAADSSPAPDAALDIVLDDAPAGGERAAMSTFSSLPAPDTVGVNPVMELAEIMLSFGRREGAVQTLQEYIEANPKEALHPWVKLLEIYREGGMRSEFDELARQLNSNFNVEVQRWDEAPVPPPPAADSDADRNADEAVLAKALTLEDVPHIREQIVARWGQPACLDYLQQLLHDNRGGQRSGFTLPVVQEILLLIDVLVAREAEGASA